MSTLERRLTSVENWAAASVLIDYIEKWEEYQNAPKVIKSYTDPIEEIVNSRFDVYQGLDKIKYDVWVQDILRPDYHEMIIGARWRQDQRIFWEEVKAVVNKNHLVGAIEFKKGGITFAGTTDALEDAMRLVDRIRSR